ncbi:MAG: Rrf2 family transcriptional regulator [Thermoleophilia bacterium]|nr:Rrf2 family transcriptional regulator [Thermoleophilia bacterium]
MIHLSTKCDYAIKALVRLALADSDAPVTGRDIVAFAGVPPKFLEQVMHDLRQAGLVESRRGKGGGYVIARDPASISFADVIDVIDGRRADSAEGRSASPVSNGGGRRMRGGDRAEALVAPVWREVRACTRAILGSATIADAAARAAEAPMYYI